MTVTPALNLIYVWQKQVKNQVPELYKRYDQSVTTFLNLPNRGVCPVGRNPANEPRHDLRDVYHIALTLEMQGLKPA